MKRNIVNLAFVLVSSSVVSCAATDDSDSADTGETARSSLLDLVLDGLGGQEVIEGLRTIQLDVDGSMSISDEGPAPGATAPGSEYAATIKIDTTSQSFRLDIDRTITFEGIGAPLAYSEVIAGPVGAIEGADNLLGLPPRPMPSDRWAATVKMQELLNPHLLLLRVLADPAIATDAGMDTWNDAEFRLLSIEDSVFPLTLWVEPETGRIARLTTKENHHLRRDVEVEVTYETYSAVEGGALFPAEVEVSLGGQTVLTETRTEVVTGIPLESSTFAFDAAVEPAFSEEDAERGRRSHLWHQMFGGIGIPLNGLQTVIVAEPLPQTDGIHHLTGGSHHSLVVEQEGGVVIFDAPLYAARCEAIVDWVEQTHPGKPISHIVVSHSHVDHGACARTFVAAGAALVVGPGSTEFWSGILKAESTIEPDRLAAAGEVTPRILEVPTDGSVVLDDAKNPIDVYALAAEHAADLVLPVVRDEGIGFVVDLYSPGTSQFIPGGAAEILDGLAEHGLLEAVHTFPGAHGVGAATLEELRAQADGGE